MKPGLLVLAILILLPIFGCAKPSNSNSPRPCIEDAQSFGATAEPLDLSAWLATDAALSQVQRRGQPLSIEVGAGAPGDRIEGTIGVPLNECVLLMARGAESISDLDLHVYGDDGAIFGMDENDDSTPTLLVCPPHPKRLFVSARVVAGHGLVAVGGQRFPSSEKSTILSVLGLDDKALPSTLDDERWPELPEQLQHHRSLLGGQWESLDRRVLPADSRTATYVSQHVRSNRCLDVFVVPDARVGHLDLEVQDLRGTVFGRGVATGRQRSMVICTPIDTTVGLRIRPHSGRGTVALLTSRSLVEGISALDVPAIRVDAAPSTSLAEQREELRQRLGARAQEIKPSFNARFRTEVGRLRGVSLPLLPGCHRLDLLAEQPVRDLDASLWSEQGELLGTARGAPPLVVITCTERTKARIEVEALAQPGNVEIELRTVAASPESLRRSPLAASRLMTRMLARGVIRSILQVTKVDELELSDTVLQTARQTVPYMRCVDIIVALAPGTARGVELRLVEATTGRELDFARGLDSAAARACSLERPEAIAVVAQMRTLTGEGAALFASRLLAPKP